jgi:hypothetical protein
MGEAETDELRLEQLARARRERAGAEEAEEPAERRAHARRADKAAYLKARLDERAESEERVEREP